MSPATATKTPVGVSCRNCPSFLVGREQRDAIGTDLMGPLCGRKMLPLVRPHQDPAAQTRTLNHMAKNCTMYGEQVKIDSLRSDAAPDMAVGIDTNVPDPTNDGSTPACFGCKNYIPPSAVQSRTGWIGGICKATGNLMPDSMTQNYALVCGRYSRQVGPRPRDPFGTFTLFPHYSDTFGYKDPTAAYKSAIDSFVNPQDYPTDRPVTPKMQERGIKAWRKVSDPEGYGPDVFLPIFDELSIPESDRDLIPKTGDSEHPELYADHSGILYDVTVFWMKLDETPALWGAGGTGKTEFARHMAYLMGLPFHRINITASSDVDDLAGKILFEDGETKPHYGRLSRAWCSKCVMLVDEPNTGQPEVWQLTRPLFDNSRTLHLDSLKSEKIHRHADCYPVLAMNPSWSPLNVGTQEIGDADASRLMHIYFDYPPDALEREIIQRRLRLDGWQMPEDKMSCFMTVAKKLREQADEGIMHASWGLRQQIKAARALRYLTPVKAYRRCLGDMLEPQQLEGLLTEVKSQFGE